MENPEPPSHSNTPTPPDDHQLLFKIIRKLILVSFTVLWAMGCDMFSPSGASNATMASVLAGIADGELITVDNPFVKRFGPSKELKWVLNKGRYQKYGVEKGVVSYYHRPQKMANGEHFDPEEMTAAHKTWPLHSIVRCKRVDNGRIVEVMITDRGPYVDGRILDLSRAAGRKLRLTGDDGIADCVVELIAYPVEDGERKSR